MRTVPSVDLRANFSTVSLDDITRWYNSSTLEDIGLPRLPSSDVITCGSDPKLSACRRDGEFRLI